MKKLFAATVASFLAVVGPASANGYLAPTQKEVSGKIYVGTLDAGTGRMVVATGMNGGTCPVAIAKANALGTRPILEHYMQIGSAQVPFFTVGLQIGTLYVYTDGSGSIVTGCNIDFTSNFLR